MSSPNYLVVNVNEENGFSFSEATYLGLYKVALTFSLRADSIRLKFMFWLGSILSFLKFTFAFIQF